MTCNRTLVDELFEEIALMIGGLAATGEMEDESVWALIRNLDAIRSRLLKRITQSEVADGEWISKTNGFRPHPAVEEFLIELRKA